MQFQMDVDELLKMIGEREAKLAKAAQQIQGLMQANQQLQERVKEHEASPKPTT